MFVSLKKLYLPGWPEQTRLRPLYLRNYNTNFDTIKAIEQEMLLIFDFN